MSAEQLSSQIIGLIKAALALLALVMGGFAIWKLAFSGFNIDAKTSAEIAICFAGTYFFLK